MGSTTSTKSKADTSSVFGADGPPKAVSMATRYPTSAQLCNELSNVLSDISSDTSKEGLERRTRAGRIVRKAIEDIGKLAAPAVKARREAPRIRRDDDNTPGASEFPDGSTEQQS